METVKIMCNSCKMLKINGVKCHETGCPDAWKDKAISCFVCGFDFIPEERFQTVCNDCQNVDQDDEMETEEEEEKSDGEISWMFASLIESKLIQIKNMMPELREINRNPETFKIASSIGYQISEIIRLMKEQVN
jgi:hypothetical protein